MNPLKIVWVLLGALALAAANPKSNKRELSRNSIKNSGKATDWMSVSELESLPSLNEITSEMLEGMSMQEGGELLHKMYHLSQTGEAIKPTRAPKPSEIPCHLLTPDNKKLSFMLSELPKIAREKNHFGNQEVTIFISGLPQATETIKKAMHKLVEAYSQRYNGNSPRYNDMKPIESGEMKSPSSSEEMGESGNISSQPTGNFVVIDLGKLLDSVQNYLSLDVEKTGMEIGDILVETIDNSNVSHEIVHLIGANIGAHVAGAAGRQYTRQTGHQLRRITGLDPAKIMTRNEYSLSGLARGDAEFVDVIHTSAYGLGTPIRCGDVDFYPNGPSEGVPGADNVVEASMRAIRYFAESVVPGNERNFPAVAATSLQQYKNQNGLGKRVYMGIATDYDAKGDYMLQVNSKSPFGRRTPAHKQQNYHKIHKPFKMSFQYY